MKLSSFQHTFYSQKVSFRLHCPFCQSAIVAHFFPKKVCGHRGVRPNGLASFILDPDDLILLFQEIPAAQISVLYGTSAKEIDHACRAVGIEVKSKDEQL